MKKKLIGLLVGAFVFLIVNGLVGLIKGGLNSTSITNSLVAEGYEDLEVVYESSNWTIFGLKATITFDLNGEKRTIWISRPLHLLPEFRVSQFPPADPTG